MPAQPVNDGGTHLGRRISTLPLLKDRAVNDASPDAKGEERIGGVRDVALQAIVRSWPDDPGTLSLIRERAQNDPTLWLREKAKQWADEIEAKGQGAGSS